MNENEKIDEKDKEKESPVPPDVDEQNTPMELPADPEDHPEEPLRA